MNPWLLRSILGMLFIALFMIPVVSSAIALGLTSRFSYLTGLFH